jgi:bis(5'-nucleosyl)-tetraphosphatase (symmetrical)
MNVYMRRIFVGDIQGCLRQLDDLLNALGVQSDDRLYCVGDLVNRGPDSLGVLRRLRDMGARIVLGNHDIHLLRICAGTRELSAKDRLRAVLAARDCEQLVGWLAQQPVMRVEADTIVVHAGLHPAWKDVVATASALNAAVAAHVNGRRDEGVDFATDARYCDADGRRPARDDPPPGPPFLPWDRFYAGDRTVVFGHWARRGLVVEPHLRGLDTGCVYGGALTAWIAEEDRMLQVPGWHGD